MSSHPNNDSASTEENNNYWNQRPWRAGERKTCKKKKWCNGFERIVWRNLKGSFKVGHHWPDVQRTLKKQKYCMRKKGNLITIHYQTEQWEMLTETQKHKCWIRVWQRTKMNSNERKGTGWLKMIEGPSTPDLNWWIKRFLRNWGNRSVVEL